MKKIICVLIIAIFALGCNKSGSDKDKTLPKKTPISNTPSELAISKLVHMAIDNDATADDLSIDDFKSAEVLKKTDTLTIGSGEDFGSMVVFNKELTSEEIEKIEDIDSVLSHYKGRFVPDFGDCNTKEKSKEKNLVSVNTWWKYSVRDKFNQNKPTITIKCENKGGVGSCIHTFQVDDRFPRLDEKLTKLELRSTISSFPKNQQDVEFYLEITPKAGVVDVTLDKTGRSTNCPLQVTSIKQKLVARSVQVASLNSNDFKNADVYSDGMEITISPRNYLAFMVEFSKHLTADQKTNLEKVTASNPQYKTPSLSKWENYDQRQISTNCTNDTTSGKSYCFTIYIINSDSSIASGTKIDVKNNVPDLPTGSQDFVLKIIIGS